MTKPVIKIESVSIVFGEKPEGALPLMDGGESREEIKQKTGLVLGVHDCSLSVGGGEIVVLMGLSGSGKSTLLRAVNGLISVIRGKVFVDDGDKMVNLIGADEQTLRFFRRQRISMVFQQFALLPWRSVADNIAYGLEVSGMSREMRQQKVQQQLEMVNLNEWGHCRVHELSGGMQQRVGLARAFATDSPILLMDEPFSALDPLIRIRLQDELLNLQKQLRRSILFVSHDLDEALKIGNRIVIMEGGRIVQIGSPEEIIINPASGYVADFVAHMNPVRSLRAATVMRKYNGDVLQNADSTAALNSDPANLDSCAVVNDDTLLLDILKCKRNNPRPVYVRRGDNIVGVIEDNDIYNALLRQE